MKFFFNKNSLNKYVGLNTFKCTQTFQIVYFSKVKNIKVVLFVVFCKSLVKVISEIEKQFTR